MTSPGLSSRTARRLTLIGCIVVWLSAFVATHIPADSLPGEMPGDKLLHAVGFFGLGVVLWVTLAANGVRAKWRVVFCLGGLLLYAAFDEITQPLFGRHAAFEDWLADGVGAIAAIAALELLRLAWDRKRSNTN